MEIGLLSMELRLVIGPAAGDCRYGVPIGLLKSKFSPDTNDVSSFSLLGCNEDFNIDFGRLTFERISLLLILLSFTFLFILLSLSLALDNFLQFSFSLTYKFKYVLS